MILNEIIKKHINKLFEYDATVDASRSTDLSNLSASDASSAKMSFISKSINDKLNRLGLMTSGDYSKVIFLDILNTLLDKKNEISITYELDGVEGNGSIKKLKRKKFAFQIDGKAIITFPDERNNNFIIKLPNNSEKKGFILEKDYNVNVTVNEGGKNKTTKQSFKFIDMPEYFKLWDVKKSDKESNVILLELDDSGKRWENINDWFDTTSKKGKDIIVKVGYLAAGYPSIIDDFNIKIKLEILSNIPTSLKFSDNSSLRVKGDITDEMGSQTGTKVLGVDRKIIINQLRNILKNGVSITTLSGVKSGVKDNVIKIPSAKIR
jgi:hypothetical protein